MIRRKTVVLNDCKDVMSKVQFGDGWANHRNEEGWQRRTRCSQLRHHVCLHPGTHASLTDREEPGLCPFRRCFLYPFEDIYQQSPRPLQ